MLPDNYETTLDFEELEEWLAARLRLALSIHIVTGRSALVFLEGPIETVMEFRAPDERGFSVEGAAGAWLLRLSKPQFVSAGLRSIPSAPTVHQLQIRMRDHIIVVEPGVIDSEGPDTDE